MVMSLNISEFIKGGSWKSSSCNRCLWSNKMELRPGYCVFVLLLWSWVDAERPVFNESYLSIMQNVTEYYCPQSKSVTCDANSSEVGQSPCCVGCSCDETCGLYDNCCYKEDDLYKLTENGILKCLYPDTRPHQGLPQMVYHMYKIVVGPPAGGCIEGGSCNSLERRIPWQTFYPVYSSTKRLNYVTEECAKCHGATDSIAWERKIIFSRLSYNTEEIFDTLLNRPSNRIYVLFEHPGEMFEKTRDVCSSRLQDKCRISADNVNSMRQFLQLYREKLPGIDVPDDLFAKACTEGPYSQLVDAEMIFKNLFCYLCSGRLTNFINRFCNPIDERSIHDPFSAVIDFEFIRLVTRDNELGSRNNVPIACKENEMEQNESSCRPVFCPTLQLRTPQGTCRFTSRKWHLPDTWINLNLTTSYPGKVDIISLFSNTSRDNILDAFNKDTPWPDCWELQFIGTRTYPMGYDHVIEVIVSMWCDLDRPLIEPLTLLNFVKNTLLRTWIIQTNIGRLYFRQDFLPYRVKLLKERSNTFSARSFIYPWWFDFDISKSGRSTPLNDSDFSKLFFSPPKWHPLFLRGYTDNFGQPVTLIKSFFCPQIELRPHEYILVSHVYEFGLILNSPRKVLFDNQFFRRKME